MSENQNRKGKVGVQGLDWLPIVVEKVQTLRHGMIGIVVHESGVAQVVVTEKIMMDKKSNNVPVR